MIPTAGAPIAALLGSWLIGTIPVSWLAARAGYSQEIVPPGNSKTSTTRDQRAIGLTVALIVFSLDAAKGAAATLLVARHAPDAAAWGGALAVIGHCWTPWLRFAGQKGVAPLLGMIAALSPLLAGIAGAVWLAAAAMTRIASVASLCAIGLIAAAQLVAGHDDSRAAILTTCLIVFFQHRDNLARLRTGEEPRLGKKPLSGAAK